MIAGAAVAVFVQHHHGAGRAGVREGHDLVHIDAGMVGDLGQGAEGRLPPFVGVLFHVAAAGKFKLWNLIIDSATFTPSVWKTQARTLCVPISIPIRYSMLGPI
jgi:hypothetical protein